MSCEKSTPSHGTHSRAYFPCDDHELESDSDEEDDLNELKHDRDFDLSWTSGTQRIRQSAAKLNQAVEQTSILTHAARAIKQSSSEVSQISKRLTQRSVSAKKAFQDRQSDLQDTFDELDSQIDHVSLKAMPTILPENKGNTTAWDKVKNAFSSMPLIPEKDERVLIPQDPLWAYRQQRAYENMANAQMFAGGVRLISEAIEMVTSKPIQLLTESAQTVASNFCRMNASTEKVCQCAKEISTSTKALADAALQKTGIADVSKSVVSAYKRNTALPQELNQLQISKAIGEQFGRDGLLVALSAPEHLTGIILKAKVVKFLSKKTVLAEGTVAKESISITKPVNPIPLCINPRREASISYLKALEKDRHLLDQMTRLLPTAVLPHDFPLHFNLFKSSCEKLPFIYSKLGKGMQGDLMYHAGQEHILFLFKRSTSDLRVHKSALIQSRKMKWPERLNVLFDTALNYAKEKDYKRVFFAWHHKEYPLLGVLSIRQESIIGVNKLSSGVGQTPLSVIEVVQKKGQ